VGQPPPPSAPAESVGDRAAADLRFIRLAMERSSAFTAVPGTGGAAMGLVGIATAIIGARQPTPDRWLAVWLVAAVVAFVIGVFTIVRKARRAGVNLMGRSTKNFVTGLMAPVAGGTGVTIALWSAGAYSAMPAAWLLMYGAGVITGGMFSVPVVRLAGLAFMICGFGAALSPPAWSNVWLGVGFGVIHFVGGIYIVRNHGG